MEHYILLHHAALISYINKCFYLLNRQLENGTNLPTNISAIYFQLIKLLQHLNSFISPLAFCMQIHFLITISIAAVSTVKVILSTNSKEDIFQLSLAGNFYILLIIHMFAYYTICNQVICTTAKTKDVLQLYQGKSNHKEIDNICLSHSITQISANIFGFFKIDLSFLFQIVSQIFLYTLILVQIGLQNVNIITRNARDIVLKKWLKEVLIQQTFNRENLKCSKNIRKLWLFNAGLLIPHIVNMYYYFGDFFPTRDLWTNIEVYFICTQLSTEHYILLHHSALLNYLNECFSLLNFQLAYVPDLPRNISSIYFQHVKLLEQLNRIYSPLAFCIQIHFLITVSIVSHTAVNVIHHAHNYSDIFELSLVGNFYILLIIHMFGYFIICHQVFRNSRQTREILQQYEGNKHNQELEEFVLQCALVPTDVKVYDSIMDLKFLFAMTAAIFSYMILLIQAYMQATMLDESIKLENDKLLTGKN
ncbi:hypothetical protein FF38_08780 [Lucilia cuprina]|uniref:Gustatory receptor n=1 Tax=Lucilia cuprina TaxID=7375 RepID=A0A0L0CMT2_LUCCU|nr:hypothetical protein FF38_08780 [Lucilia cuprina]